MKYSIIIPTLNEEKLLPILLDQLDDIELKTKYKFEIIISDGGSSDGTQQIAMSKADKLIVHDKKTRQNISQGRNEGAKHADGEWLIFMNGDVSISNVNLFFNLLNSITQQNKYKGITFSVEITNNLSLLRDKIFLGFYNYYFHFLNIIGLGMGRGECLVLSKNTFNELNGFNENLAAGEDFDLFRRVRRLGKIYFSHNIKIYESPRRYRKYGHFRIMFTWLLNSIYALFRKKSHSREWEEVR